MKKVVIALDDAVYQFYQKVGKSAGDVLWNR